MITNSEISVSIIILVKNGERYLRSLLDAVMDQKISGQFEVLVIDSGSSDDSLHIVADYPDIRLFEIPPGEFGHGRTRNLGARLARGQYLVFIPQDATPVGQGWLERLLCPFETPSIAGVYARQVPRDDANAMERFFLIDRYTSQPEIRSLPAEGRATLERCFFSTVSGAVRASVWARYPFREDIIMSEDQAWASEVMKAGYSIAYEPGSCVLHSHQYGIPDVFRRNFDSGYSIRQIYAGKTGMPLYGTMVKLLREAVFVLRTGKGGEWLLFLPYEAARHMGFLLGLHAERLPVSMRRKFSSLRYFWERPSEMAK